MFIVFIFVFIASLHNTTQLIYPPAVNALTLRFARFLDSVHRLSLTPPPPKFENLIHSLLPSQKHLEIPPVMGTTDRHTAKYPIVHQYFSYFLGIQKHEFNKFQHNLVYIFYYLDQPICWSK